MDDHFNKILGSHASKNATKFIPAKTFEGRKPGYVFHNGDFGVGYYLDSKHTSYDVQLEVCDHVLKDLFLTFQYRKGRRRSENWSIPLLSVSILLKYAPVTNLILQRTSTTTKTMILMTRSRTRRISTSCWKRRKMLHHWMPAGT